MKRLLFAVALTVVLAFNAEAARVAVNIGQPGFYGRIYTRGYPQPQLLYLRPAIVRPVAISRPPIYLYVPPGHARYWHRHCWRYNACSRRVYFVQDNWYRSVYVPRYLKSHRDRHWSDDDDRGRGHKHKKHHHED